MLGPKIKYYRAVARLSQAELGARVGLSAKVISTIETDRRLASLADVELIAKALNLDAVATTSLFEAARDSRAKASATASVGARQLELLRLLIQAIDKLGPEQCLNLREALEHQISRQ